MEIKVIGYWGAYPDAGSATSSYLVERDGFTCLLDCGSGALSRLQLYIKPMDLDAVILSHYHHDHFADIGPLQYAILVQNAINGTKNSLPIYGHQENMEAFKKLTSTATVGVPYNPSEGLEIGPFHIEFLKTIHPVPCYAMKITDGRSSIVYTADTSYFDELVSFSQNADLLIAECSFYEGMDSSGPGHMTSDQCGKLARDANVNELWLTHLPHFGDINQLKKEAGTYYKGKIELAKEALSFRLS